MTSAVVDTPLQNPPELHAGRRLANRYRLDRPLAPPGSAELAMHRQVKDAFDPSGRLNPGVLPW